MRTKDLFSLTVEQKTITSSYLKRPVVLDFYLPKNIATSPNVYLLLINDGQHLEEMKFAALLDQLLTSQQIGVLLCVGIHAGVDRKNEYGTADRPDYMGRGAKASAYHQFVIDELISFIHTNYHIARFREKAFAGFSLGGLMAIDMTWKFHEMFSIAGVFSGSLWWRSKSLEADYDDNRDRIMHQLIREGRFHEGLRFYFTTGSLDEKEDRNHNGVIDSIDDTLALISELKKIGYDNHHIHYINYEDGKHDIATWARAMPHFLIWGWGSK